MVFTPSRPMLAGGLLRSIHNGMMLYAVGIRYAAVGFTPPVSWMLAGRTRSGNRGLHRYNGFDDSSVKIAAKTGIASSWRS